MRKLEPLIIDVDGTFIKNDLTHEMLLMAIVKYPFKFLSLLLLGITSKSKLKTELVRLVGDHFDTDHLPLNDVVIDRAKSHKANGGEVVLCSGSEQTIVGRLAARFDWIDKAFGSTENRNLTDQTKADFLEESYPDGFTYIGNSTQDYAVWEKSSRGLAVSPPAGTSKIKTALGEYVETIVPKSSKIRPLLKVLRLHQWAKNVLIFLIPCLTLTKLTTLDITYLLPGFVAMGLLASGTYIFNDLLDIQNDRNHPSKKNRPFANGSLSISRGIVLMFGCLISSAIITAFLPLEFGFVLALYFAVTLSYTVLLKRKAIVDVFTLAFLFTIRVIAGAAIVGEPASPWLISFIFTFFLSLSLTKRYTELVKLESKNKKDMSGRGYSLEDKSLIIAFGTMANAIAMLSFILYGLLAQTPVLQSDVSIFMIGVMLSYWLMRMWLLAHRGHMNDDPILFAVQDKHSIIIGGLIMMIVVAEQWGRAWVGLF